MRNAIVQVPAVAVSDDAHAIQVSGCIMVVSSRPARAQHMGQLRKYQQSSIQLAVHTMFGLMIWLSTWLSYRVFTLLLCDRPNVDWMSEVQALNPALYDLYCKVGVQPLHYTCA